MALIRWSETPFNSMERVMHGAMRRPASFEELDMPNVDLSEDSENYYIISELPGSQNDEVRVTVSDDLLTISGHKHRKGTQQERKQYRNEITYGDFLRSFSLPRNVAAEGISGTFRDGLLEITLPKATKAMPPKREISLITTSENNRAKPSGVAPTGQEKTEARRSS